MIATKIGNFPSLVNFNPLTCLTQDIVDIIMQLKPKHSQYHSSGCQVILNSVLHQMLYVCLFC
jgi:hypothetical protein